ncbi:MAG: hypothetical protein MZW92_14570 [Comamonadaceae bacterium]|nr:hypothetical protein [Comamonadaceae bacterium]
MVAVAPAVAGRRRTVRRRRGGYPRRPMPARPAHFPVAPRRRRPGRPAALPGSRDDAATGRLAAARDQPLGEDRRGRLARAGRRPRPGDPAAARLGRLVALVRRDAADAGARTARWSRPICRGTASRPAPASTR